MNVSYRGKPGWTGQWVALLSGVGAGSALAYFLDPDRGAHRRSALLNGAYGSVRRSGRFLEAAASDLANRARGLKAMTTRAEGPVSDDIIVARVRSALGHVVSHPHAIEVSAQDGKVTLRGPILAREADTALRTAGKVDGVREVYAALEVHEEAGNEPSLQGPGKPASPRLWTPGIRLLAGAAGAAFGLWGASRGGLLGYAAASAGALALTRSLLNAPLASIVGVGGAGQVKIQETIELNVPIETVFGFWSDFENFHRFMQHVRSVQVLDDRHSHWVVAGPAGSDVEWDAECEIVPYDSISWRTTPDSPVHHTGRVRFTPANDGATQVHLQMTWQPVGGLAGRALASILGADPRDAIAQDLSRFKSIVEGEAAPPRAFRVQMPG